MFKQFNCKSSETQPHESVLYDTLTSRYLYDIHLFPTHEVSLFDHRVPGKCTYFYFQTKGLEFNRGFLFNVGYKEALKDSDYDCFVLHDVDLLPENDHNIYTCPDQPKHLAIASEKWQYK